MSKMGCINSKNQKEAITRSKQIDRILRADGEKLTSEVKLLLLGMSHTKDYLISRFKLIINNITRDQVASERAFWMCVCKWFKKWHHRICLCVCMYSWVNGRVTKINKKITMDMCWKCKKNLINIFYWMLTNLETIRLKFPFKYAFL